MRAAGDAIAVREIWFGFSADEDEGGSRREIGPRRQDWEKLCCGKGKLCSSRGLVRAEEGEKAREK